MANVDTIPVVVAYAVPDRQVEYEITVSMHCTIAEAIARCQVLRDFPEIDLTQNRVGVFGTLKSASDCVEANDRIEIYRPLLLDPKAARRQRAAHQKSFKKKDRTTRKAM